MKRRKSTKRWSVAISAVAALSWLPAGCVSVDSLPPAWEPVAAAKDCSWIDGTYEATGQVADPSPLDVAHPVKLVPELRTALIDRGPVDLTPFAKVERVALSWHADTGQLRVAPLGAVGEARPAAFECDDGHLQHHGIGPSLEKDWVGMGSEGIELWPAADGGLVVRSSVSIVMAVYLFMPMAAGGINYSHFARVPTP